MFLNAFLKPFLEVIFHQGNGLGKLRPKAAETLATRKKQGGERVKAEHV